MDIGNIRPCDILTLFIPIVVVVVIIYFLFHILYLPFLSLLFSDRSVDPTSTFTHETILGPSLLSKVKSTILTSRPQMGVL